MFGRVIVGYEGSSHAEDALELAALLAEATGAGLLVVYVHQAQPKWQAIDRDYQRDVRDKLQVLFERVRGRLPQGLATETTSFASAHPAQGLKEVVKSEKNAVMVLGPTHRGPIGRVTIGSVGEQLLAGVPCSVAVAPRGFHQRDGGSLGVIGVAFDGSPEAKVALRDAQTLAAGVNARLRALTVVKKRGADTAALERALEEVQEEPDSPRAELTVLDGDPAKALAEAGEELDLLVTGSRAQGPVRNALVGSVSAKLMRTAPCPVLVVAKGAKASRDS